MAQESTPLTSIPPQPNTQLANNSNMAQASTPLTSIPSLPVFSPDEQWLTLSSRILEKTAINANNTAKFLALYSALPKDIQKDHQDLLVSDEEDTYKNLVAQLKKRFCLHDYQKFQSLHTLESIGDRSPTQFLRDLRHKYTAAGVKSDSNLRYAFACGLPAEYRNIIFASNPDSLNDAAARVEELWNANKAILPGLQLNTPPLYQIQPHKIEHSAPLNCNADMALLKAEENLRLTKVVEDMSALIQNLNKRLDKLEQTSPQQSYNQYSSNSRKPPSMNSSCPPPPSPQNPQNLCRYHISFGAKAKNCIPGCQFIRLRVPAHQCNYRYCPWQKFTHSKEN
jgi:hypothetical protein